MAPPPATPTPHRFLVPKRSAATQHQQPIGRTESPRPPPLRSGETQQQQKQQFQATPRFSLHSTPRASVPSPTPAPPPGTFRRRQQRGATAAQTTIVDDDVIDSSPPIREEDEEDPSEVDLIQESSPTLPELKVESGHDDDEDLPVRSPKRRRLSIVSDLGIEESSQVSVKEEDDGSASQQQLPGKDDNGDVESSSLLDLDITTDEDRYGDADTVLPPSYNHSRDTPAAAAPGQQQQQPTFHKAPRFKQHDLPMTEAARRDPLPDAFSPHHRRGASNKYAPGGLAAEVRDWLVGIEAGSGVVKRREEGEWAVRLVIGDVRAAPGMGLLVSSRRVRDGLGEVEMLGSGGGGDGDEPEHDTKLILAGQGRLVGLARRNEVSRGAVVGIAGPTWEVELGGLGSWVVACDWMVLG
ncbi:hypothetical protein DL766_008399 [Monosporascus sp. MC13-8B]|uniref:Uncharacterized protein n=1 Tax=Monosporascus cannonballus TaxID=155416 RepID=A0ABY0HB23_9PEZI|nr:hypothetical protein DL763_010354 [Monosporascus cannonballus]RYO89000.1 hypothetical protein DL762_003430 [Monosporascus cannonballus]RYP19621.1 hypothetical protein DL766_008399 [Monosporascus sp. MC13-8B]